METYNDKIAKKSKVELILVSLDAEKDDALTWAKKENFPWPHVQMAEFEKKESELDFKKVKITAVPTYILIDKKGKVVAQGKEAVFKKARIK